MTIAEAAAKIEQRGNKDIWQDCVTGAVYFCDFEDLPAPFSHLEGYEELSVKDLLTQAESRVHW